MSGIHGRISAFHRRNRLNKRKNNSEVKKETPQNIIKTNNPIQEKPTQKGWVTEYFDNFKEEVKQDFHNVQDNFEKEGATPAVLDGIFGTANIGKNIIKGVQKSGDTLFECTKTGQEGFDNIVSDGIGKTASGIIGTVGEAVSTVGSIFSTQDGSTAKAVKNLGKESGKIVEGSKNFLLGAVGKGWLWGSKEKETVPEKKSVEKPLNEIPKTEEIKVETKEEDDFIQSCIDSVEENIKQEPKKDVKINMEPEIPDKETIEYSNLFNEILENQQSKPLPKETLTDVEKALEELKELEELKQIQPTKQESEKPKINYSDITPEKIIKNNPKIEIQEDLKDLLNETKVEEVKKEEPKQELIEIIKETPTQKIKKEEPVKNTINSIKELIEELEKQEENDFSKTKKHSFIITR